MAKRSSRPVIENKPPSAYFLTDTSLLHCVPSSDDTPKPGYHLKFVTPLTM